MFGFSWGEIILIGIVGLIAIGPKELPNVLRELGRFMGRMRKMADELRGAFDQLARESDVAEIRRIGLENRPRQAPLADSALMTESPDTPSPTPTPPQTTLPSAPPATDDDRHIPPHP